jgi:hypothetical protein
MNKYPSVDSGPGRAVKYHINMGTNRPSPLARGIKRLFLIVLVVAVVPFLSVSILAAFNSPREPFSPYSTEYFMHGDAAVAMHWMGARPWAPWLGELAECSIEEKELERRFFDNNAASVISEKLSPLTILGLEIVCAPRSASGGIT